MNRKISKFLLSLLAVFMLLGTVNGVEMKSDNALWGVSVTANAASKKTAVKKSKITLTVGKTYKQKLLSKKGKEIAADKVKWSSAKTSVAKISAKGKITAVAEGTAKMTAKYKGKSYSFTVTVKKPTLSNKSKTLYIGGKFTLSLKDHNGKAITSGVKWKTADTTKATVSSKGTVTASAAGKVKITATYKGLKFVCKVTVKEPSVTISKSSLSLELGSSATLTASSSPSADIRWSTTDSGIAKVSGGKITAVGRGTATIKATASINGKSYTAYCIVDVKAKAPTTTKLFENSDIIVYYDKVQKSRYDEDRAELYFRVKNKRSRKIKIQADAVSLNGYCFANLTCSDDISGNATGTVDVTISDFDFDNVNINNIQTVGAQLRIIYNTETYDSYDICFANKSLFGEEDSKTVPEVTGKNKVYSDANITVYFAGAKEKKYDPEDRVIYLLVQNNTDRTVLIQNDDVVVGGESFNNTVMSDRVLPHTTGLVDVTVRDCSYSPSSIKTIRGCFRIIDDSNWSNTYDANFGEFLSYDPWTGESYEDDDYYDDDYDDGYDDDYDDGYDDDYNDSDNDDSDKEDNLWGYSDITSINTIQNKASQYSDKFFEQLGKTSSGTPAMKVTYMTIAQGYADLAMKEWNKLVELCASKAEITFTLSGEQKTLLQVVTENRDIYQSISTAVVDESNVSDMRSEFNTQYGKALNNDIIVAKIYGELLKAVS